MKKFTDLTKQAQSLSQVVDTLSSIFELDHPDKIAAFLEKQKIRGVPEDGDSCPLATYIKKKINKTGSRRKKCSVAGDGEITIGNLECKANAFVRKFVHNFDKGEYPNITVGGQKACNDLKEQAKIAAAKARKAAKEYKERWC